MHVKSDPTGRVSPPYEATNLCATVDVSHLLKIISDDSSPVARCADTKPVMDAECLLVELPPSINKPTGADQSSQGRLDRLESCFPEAGRPRPAARSTKYLPRKKRNLSDSLRGSNAEGELAIDPRYSAAA